MLVLGLGIVRAGLRALRWRFFPSDLGRSVGWCGADAGEAGVPASVGRDPGYVLLGVWVSFCVVRAVKVGFILSGGNGYGLLLLLGWACSVAAGCGCGGEFYGGGVGGIGAG